MCIYLTNYNWYIWYRLYLFIYLFVYFCLLRLISAYDGPHHQYQSPVLFSFLSIILIFSLFSVCNDSAVSVFVFAYDNEYRYFDNDSSLALVCFVCILISCS